MSRTIAQHAAEARRFPEALKKAGEDGSRKVAVGLTEVGRRNTRAVAPRGRLNVGRAGAKVGVRYVKLRGGAWQVRATGPYQLIERDTKGHIEPRGSRRKKRVLLIPGIGFRKSVRHPGTKGRHPFGRAVEEFSPRAGKIWQGEVRKSLGKTFG